VTLVSSGVLHASTAEVLQCVRSTVTLQAAILLIAAISTIAAAQFDDSGFDSSLHLFGHNVQSSLGMVLAQSGAGGVYQGVQRGTLSPGTHPNVNCC